VLPILFVEQRIHSLSHGLIHLDERRPGAFEAFAGESFRRINAKFAAAGDFARRVVEHVGWAFGEEAVALRVGVRGESQPQRGGIFVVGR